MTAFAEGETLEFRISDKDAWQATDTPVFFPQFQYRIAPKPAVVWAVYEQDGTPAGHVKSNSDAQALASRKVGRYIKKFVEEKAA